MAWVSPLIQIKSMYIQWIPQRLELFLRRDLLKFTFFFLLLNLQIIKASTTAREGTTTSSLRGLRHRRPRLQLISPSSPPQAPRAPPLVVWTTPCRATTPQAKCSATRISCPTTRGTLRVQNPASLGPCTASPRRCLVLARPLPHCLWTAADTTTTCPTRLRKWTKALCGSFLRADSTGVSFSKGGEGGGVVCWRWIWDTDIDRVRATPLNIFFEGLCVYLFIFHLIC